MSPDYAGADVVLVNTCGFLDSAKEESLAAIGEAIAENGRVIVTGCMGKEAELIRARFPEVLAITGAAQYEEVVGAVHVAAPIPPSAYLEPGAGRRAQADPAPLQLSEDLRGLQPSLRLLHHPDRCAATSSAAAPTRSCARPRSWSRRGRRNCWSSARTPRPTASTCSHAAWPWKGGEVRAHMTDLARELGRLGAWVRLHYVYPYPHVDQVIPLMAEGLVLPYLDIPFQHASPQVLKAMKRPANEAQGARADPRLARDLPRHRHPLDLHRRLPRRDRGGFRLSARMARRGPARPRRRLPLRAGQRRRRQRPARRGARGGQGGALRPLHGEDRRHLRRQARGQGRPHDRRDHRRGRSTKAAPPAAPRPTRPRSTARSTCATPAIWRRATSSRCSSRMPTSTTCSACRSPDRSGGLEHASAGCDAPARRSGLQPTGPWRSHRPRSRATRRVA